MIKKFLSLLGIVIVVAVSQRAEAQTAIDGVAVGNDTVIPEPVPLQADRRLSNQELSELINGLRVSNQDLDERIEMLEARLRSEQSHLEQFEVELATNQSQIQSVEDDHRELTDEVGGLSDKVSSTEATLSSERDQRVEDIGRLEQRISDSVDNINDIKSISSAAKTSAEENRRSIDQLDGRVEESEVGLAEQKTGVDSRFVELTTVLSSRTLYGGLAALIFALIIVLLGRKMATSRHVLVSQIADSNESSQNKYLNLDLRISDLLEGQLKLAQSGGAGDSEDGQPDHTLPLQVAAEIHRMKKRLANIPEGTKGVQPLAKALERLEENLESKGYELVDLIGEKYVEGMTVQASFSVDDDLDSGEKIITRVIKPQVNYRDAVLQVADVEVSVGE